jgi:hypothetical protein
MQYRAKWEALELQTIGRNVFAQLARRDIMANGL